MYTGKFGNLKCRHEKKVCYSFLLSFVVSIGGTFLFPLALVAVTKIGFSSRSQFLSRSNKRALNKTVLSRSQNDYLSHIFPSCNVMRSQIRCLFNSSALHYTIY